MGKRNVALVVALVLIGVAGLGVLDGRAARVAASVSRHEPAPVRVDTDGVWAVRRSGSVTRLFRVEPGHLGTVEPSPSHRRVAIRHTRPSESGPRLTVVDVVTGLILHSVTGEDLARFAWSGDHHLVVSGSGSRRLDRLELRTGRRTAIWEGDDVVRSFVVSPDGRQVVFQRECPCDTGGTGAHSLFAIGSDGSNVRPLLSPLHYLDTKQMVFAPDGRRVAVLARGQRSVVDIATGALNALGRSPQYYPEEPHQGLLPGFQFDEVIGWSASSDWVAYAHPHMGGVVYRPDASGAVEDVVSPNGFAFGPAGRIATLRPNGTGLPDLVTATLPGTDGPVVMGQAASPLWPHGGALYAAGPTGRSGEEYGLWRLSPDGGARHRVAFLPQGPDDGAATADLATSTIRVMWPEGGPDAVVDRSLVLYFPPT